MRKAFGIVAATLAAPVAIAVAFTVLRVLRVGWFAGKGLGLVATNIAVYAGFAAPIALGVSLLAGLPLATWLARRGRSRAIHFVLLGASLGALPFLLFDAYVVAYELVAAFRHEDELGRVVRRFLADVPFALSWLALGVWCGVWSSLAYWLVAVPSSPSRSATVKAPLGGGDDR